MNKLLSRKAMWLSLLTVSLCTWCTTWSCTRDAPGVSCRDDSECYADELCVEFTCVVSQDVDVDMERVDMRVEPLDMPADLKEIDMPDMTLDRDLDAGQDDLPPKDLGKMDMPPEDMPILPPEDMPPKDMPPEDMPTASLPMVTLVTGELLQGARLAGSRAALLSDDVLMVLAYFKDIDQGTLALYHFDTLGAVTPIKIASQLQWPATGLEHAGLFESTGPRVLYEVHTPGNGIELRTAKINPGTWLIQDDEAVLTRQAGGALGFDFREGVNGSQALVVLSNKIERRARQGNGSWNTQETYQGTFQSARFMVSQTSLCGLTTGEDLLCFSDQNANTPVIMQSGVSEFVSFFEEDKSGDLNKDKEFVIMSKGTELYSEEMENKQNGKPQDRGLKWKKEPKESDAPGGDRLALARASEVLTYRPAQGSSYCEDVKKKDAVATRMTYESALTSPALDDKTLHIFGSGDATSSVQRITYEVHVLP